MCTLVQSSRDDAKYTVCKSQPRKVLDVQDADKSVLDDTGLHTECQVGYKSCNVLSAKTTPVSHNSSKSENYTCIQTGFHDINTSNMSSGMRENTILTNLTPKFGGKNMIHQG